MNKKKQKLAFRIATLITCAVFLVLSLLFAVASLILNRSNSNSENSYIVSSEEQDESSTEALENASQVFGESSVNIDEVVSKEPSSEPSSDDIVEELHHDFIHNIYGHTFIYGDSGFEQFNYGENALNRYINGLNALSEYFPENTKVYNITVPISTTYVSIPREIYTQHDFYNKSQGTFVSKVVSGLDPKITNIPIVEKLQERYDNGEYLFFRTDNNWTPLAAYTAYAEFCNAKGLNAYAISGFPKTEQGDFLGRFYFATKDENMKGNPDILSYFSTVPSVSTSLTVYDNGSKYTNYNLCGNKVDVESGYGVFVGIDAGRYEINSTANGGNLLIIGDSSVYPVLPFLASHYSKIDFINPANFDLTVSEFLQNRQYDDVITMCYTTNATAGDYMPAFNTFIEASNENE
ncbi:MAG: hypothetical protein E7586_00550 [Ruminococcaceae bacterium]|nr:hypothetical protein [Oscillospiraceae bacterium]